MRRGFLAAAVALAGLFAGMAFAQPLASRMDSRLDDSAQRVIQVSTRGGNGPVHQHLTLALDKAAVIQLDTDARDVLVSNPEIVDAVVRTPRRVFLLAMKTGQTNAFFFDAQGRQLLSIDIRVEKDVADLSDMIRNNMPGSNVRVSALNDNVVLTGTVASQEQSTRSQDLAARFAGDPTKVVNMLQVAGGEQVMLKVRVAEMQRTIAKQFGINLQAAAIAGGVPISLATDNEFGLIGHALSDISGGQIGQACNALGNTGTCTGGPNNIQSTFKALEQVGLIHTLAEPNLTAVSGETAKFLAGGEFPVPVSRDLQGNITVEFKQFGVGLSFTPIVLSSGRISLQISTEVSELTNTGAFTLQGNPTTGGGLTIPALDVRRAETTVELPSGGSFAIAGLMQHTAKQVLDQFPGLKDMPVLGALFRSRDFENDESELVVVVSAYLVSPTAEAKLAAPTDGFAPPNDVDTIVNGRLNTVYKRDSQELKPAPQNTVGFIVQ